jgi:hypothetical protein
MNRNTLVLALLTATLSGACWAAADASAPSTSDIAAQNAAAILSADAATPDAPAPVDDETLLKRVAPAASQAAAQVGARIETRIQGGEVTLTGTAPNEDALRRVAEEVSHVPGIKSVRTDVEIKAAD